MTKLSSWLRVDNAFFGDLTAPRRPAARYGARLAPKRDAEATNIVAVIEGPE